MVDLEQTLKGAMPDLTVVPAPLAPGALTGGHVVVYRLLEKKQTETLDLGAAGPVYELRCLAHTYPNADRLAADVINALKGSIATIREERDDDPDDDRARGFMFVRLLVIELSP